MLNIFPPKNQYSLIKKEQLSKTIWGFWFSPSKVEGFNHHSLSSWNAGQYLEWVLPHSNPDKRGIRRFFTISTSPTENELMVATKIIDKPSSFKANLRNMKVGDAITARGLEGDFVLPKNEREKLLFIVGGIGITPFRAMIKYLLDTGEKRDIILLYANKTSDDVAFVDLLKQAEKVGLKTIYFFAHNPKPTLPTYGVGKGVVSVVGFVDEMAIKKQVPDWQERMFYISGPEPMVEAMEKMVKAMGVKGRRIKTDFFPGYED